MSLGSLNSIAASFDTSFQTLIAYCTLKNSHLTCQSMKLVAEVTGFNIRLIKIIAVSAASAVRPLFGVAESDMRDFRPLLLRFGHLHLPAVQLEPQDQQHGTPSPVPQPGLHASAHAVERPVP